MLAIISVVDIKNIGLVIAGLADIVRLVVLCVLHVQKKVNQNPLKYVHSKSLSKATTLKIYCVLYAYRACTVEIRFSSLDVKTSGNSNVKIVGLEVICVYCIIVSNVHKACERSYKLMLYFCRKRKCFKEECTSVSFFQSQSRCYLRVEKI